MSSYPTPLPLPPPFVPLIRVGSVRDTSFAYLRILFQHKKQNQKFLPIRWKRGSIPIILPPPFPPTFGGLGSSIRSPLIFWDIFPTYLRMLFQHIKRKKKILPKLVNPYHPSSFFPTFGGLGSSTRSPLIFWYIFPTYSRMLFQHKIRKK